MLGRGGITSDEPSMIIKEESHPNRVDQTSTNENKVPTEELMARHLPAESQEVEAAGEEEVDRGADDVN